MPSPVPPSPGSLLSSPESVASLIDHTLLRPDATPSDVARLCSEADLYRFRAVCVNPVHVARARAVLRSAGVRVCAVAGFPLGADRTDVKVFAARAALADGAGEIDMVIDVGALKAGEDLLVVEEIRAVAGACHEAGGLCKVILETSLLSRDEKLRGAGLAVEGGADFVKTSTGFGAGGATAADVALLAEAVRAAGLGVKASGGIRSLDDLVRMVQAGATRIGTSSGVRIMEETRDDFRTGR